LVPSIVGPDVPDQAVLRPPRPVRDLDEYLEFLRRIEAMFGRVARPPRPTLGDRFRL
jgi:hypothetical protein